VPTGIGDFSWVYSKLASLEIPVTIEVCAGGPARLQPIAELLPRIERMYTGNIGYGELAVKQLPAETTRAQLMAWPAGAPIPLSCNTHLENGNRVETWLPDIPTYHHYPVLVSQQDIDQAKALVPFKDYVCIYASSKATCATWTGWMGPQWVEFMNLFRDKIAPMSFVLIGAQWDVDLGVEVQQCAAVAQIPFVNLVNLTRLGTALKIIKNSHYMVSFPSGMGIMSHVIRQPCTMFYPSPLVKMLRTFVSPESAALNRFHETIFCPPAELIQWLLDVYKIKEHL